ncbi:hypothetical protein [Streptomyces sp. NPDC093060]|uniref:hypothetical protein n=1 Tax=Streptomyces sp. NPDC093060 TaxID=3366019 RepID=UPI0038164C3B
MSEVRREAGGIFPPPYPKNTPHECGTGQPICGKPARLYAVGWRCDIHNPAAWAARQQQDDGEAAA